MEEYDFVDFSLAVRLKEKGFRKPCVATYDKDGMLGYNYYQPESIEAVSFDYCLCISDDLVLAPTISQVLKWLRKEKKIHIVCPFYKDKGFYYYVQRIGNAARIVSSFGDSDDCFDTTEQAAIAGIEYVLDNLI